MTLAAVVASLAVAAASVAWSVLRARSAHREASQAADVAVSSLLLAVAASKDASRSRYELEQTRRRVLAMDEELIAINRRILDAGADVPARNAVLGGRLIRERQHLGELLGRQDG